MKKLLFKLMLLICSIIVIMVLSDMYLDHRLDDNSFYKLNNSVRVLIIGNSHSQCALDDSLISQSVNLSQGGESYYYTYYKLKKIIEANPKIKSVILEFTNNIFNTEDKWTYSDEHLLFKYTVFSQLIPMNDKIYLLYKNPVGYLAAYAKAMKIKTGLLHSNNDELYKKLDWGRYLSLDRNEIPKLKQKQQKTVMRPNNSDANLKLVSKVDYLIKIANYCKLHNVELILFRSPLHPFYNRRNETELKYLVKSDFKDIQFWDYADYPLNEQEYGDFEHLNNKGAKVFSKTVNARIQQMLMSDSGI